MFSIKEILHLFFPELCLACNTLLSTNEEKICTTCRHNIPFSHYHLNKNNPVYSKFYGKIPLTFATSIFLYHKNGVVQELIHKLKYKSQQEIGVIIAHWYEEIFIEISNMYAFDYLVPVPLHPKKHKSRGYNQLTSFGNTLSKISSIPFREDILLRKQFSVSQTKKNLQERSKISEDIFIVSDTFNENGIHILLIDDVITTGATLEMCCKSLLTIPNITISILCMAQTH